MAPKCPRRRDLNLAYVYAVVTISSPCCVVRLPYATLRTRLSTLPAQAACFAWPVLQSLSRFDRFSTHIPKILPISFRWLLLLELQSSNAWWSGGRSSVFFFSAQLHKKKNVIGFFFYLASPHVRNSMPPKGGTPCGAGHLFEKMV